MPRRTLLSFGLLGITVSFLILYYTVLFFGAKPHLIQRDTVQVIEAISGGKFQYGKFNLFYFPRLQSEFHDVILEGRSPVPFQLKARKAKFHFSFWGFLFGKANISYMNIEGGEIHIALPERIAMESMDIQNLKIKIKTGNSLRKVRASWEGDLESIPQSISGKMELEVKDPAKFVWNQTSLSADFNLKEFPLASFQKSLQSGGNFSLKEGAISGKFNLEKARQDAWFHLTGQTQLKQFRYGMRAEINYLESPSADAAFDFELDGNPLEEQLRLKRSVLTSPLGKLETSGHFNLLTREIKNGRITFSDLMLETIPQYYLPFREAVPFNLGFSGKSNLEMTIEGTLDHLSLHGNWDLSSTLLTYAGFFAKSKDMPCGMSFDILLRNHQLLSGDFSLRLQEAGFKGSLTDLNLVTGEGQLNLLSNKFKLENWTPLLTPFAGYQVGGEFKVLANFEGNLLQKPKELKSMINLILENGEISKGGERLYNIYVAADFSPISFEIKNAQLQSGEYPLMINAMVYDPKTQPRAKVRLSSEEMDLSHLLRSIDSLGKKWFPATFKKRLRRLRDAVEPVLPRGQLVKDFAFEIEAKPDEITIPVFQGKAYLGDVNASGKISTPSTSPAYDLQLEINRLNLTRFFNRTAESAKLMDGNFFLKGSFQGKSLEPENWQSSLTGSGMLSVTNGQFNTFSVMKTIAGLQPLSMLSKEAPEGTPFNDFQSQFEILENKFRMEKATLISRDIKAYGDGAATLDGSLNHRLNIYLAWSAAKETLESYLGSISESEEDFLGPIPLLLSGEWEHPQLQTDPSRIAEFTENFAKKKVQKVLRNFLPEEVLFDRGSKP